MAAGTTQHTISLLHLVQRKSDEIEHALVNQLRTLDLEMALDMGRLVL